MENVKSLKDCLQLNIPASSTGYFVDGWKQQHANHTYNREFDNSLNCHYLQMQRSDDSVTTALVYGVAELPRSICKW